jgi:hypothetical protein
MTRNLLVEQTAYLLGEDLLEESINDKSLFKAVFMAGGPGCFAKGTPILLSDGNIIPVEEVRVGMEVIGADGKPKKVLETHSGKSEMVKVIPIKGDPHIVNVDHVLVLTPSGRINSNYQSGVLYDTSVRNFVGFPNKAKTKLKLRRSGVVQFPKKELPVDPYYVGIWLGDGTRGQTTITKPDVEIHQWLTEFALSIGMESDTRIPKDVSKTNGHSPITVVRKKGWKKGRNPVNFVLDFVRSFVVDGQKIIPIEYLTASVEDRLTLLAGLIDTDGTYDNGIYGITTKYDKLRDGILFLARSLGFGAYSSEVEKSIKSRGFKGKYHSIKISGHIDQIPCKIPRKRASPRQCPKDVLNVGFEIEPIGKGTYYGFSIEGDGRFLLGDFTITHNSGKGFVNDKIFSGTEAKVVNSDDLLEFLLTKNNLPMKFDPKDEELYAKQMAVRKEAKKSVAVRQDNYINGMLPIVIDGTGKDFDDIRDQAEKLKKIGYDVGMVFVNTTLDVAKARNKKRARTVPDHIVENGWHQVQANLGKFQNYFGAGKFFVVDNSEVLEGDALNEFKTNMARIGIKLLRSPLENKRGKNTIEFLQKIGGKYLSDIPEGLK